MMCVDFQSLLIYLYHLFDTLYSNTRQDQSYIVQVAEYHYYSQLKTK